MKLTPHPLMVHQRTLALSGSSTWVRKRHDNIT